ncbi:MAG: serine protease Do [Chloroflexota bacterium]|nr:serine protease Do [Chloroflexota bacterium]
MATVLEELTQSAVLAEETAALAAKVKASVVVVRGAESGGGAGVVWSDQGLVITNYHVVPGDRAEVAPRRGDAFRARVIASSPELDIAALQVEGDLAASGARPAEIGDSTRLRVGQLVMAVGNPLGERNAVTVGIVNAVGDEQARWRGGNREAIRAAITLRPGNSGGALTDAFGRVIGIPNMVVGTGLALAVPSHVVQRFLLSERGERAFFGIAGEWIRIPNPLREQFEIPARVGMLLAEVAPASPAERAGLLIGDLVVAAGGAAVDTDLASRLATAPLDRPTELAVIRAGELRLVGVTPVALAPAAEPLAQAASVQSDPRGPKQRARNEWKPGWSWPDR